MSHFTVLVHLKEEELQNGVDVSEVLANKLQPFHEFECTGNKDQYVVKFDNTEEKLNDYNNETVDAVYDRDGALVGNKYSEQCKRFWHRKGHGYSSEDEFVLPEGYELRNTPLKDIYTFEGYLRDWCGYQLDGEYSEFEDGRFYRFTNPNAKWDWWTVGGRWSGMFLDKSGNNHDVIQRKDWDIETEALNAVRKYAPFFDRFEASSDMFNGVEFKSWEEVCEMYTTATGTDYNAARTFYHAQEYKNILKSVFSEEGDSDFDWLLHDPNTFYNVQREDFIKARIYGNIGTFAVLDDAGWHEKGEMGWWACVSNEKSNWNQIYLDKINSIADNDVLVLVDCHI